MPPDELEDESDRRFGASMLALVAETANFVFAVYEIEDDLLYLSSQWSSLTRGAAGPTYLDSRQFGALIHPDDGPAVWAKWSACLRGEREYWHAEMRVRSVDGAWRPLLMQARIGDRDQFGKPRRIVGTIFDLSDYRRESRLRDDQLRSTFEQNPNGIVLATAAGRILRANPAACRIAGYAEAELQQIGCDRLFEFDDRYAAARDDGEPVRASMINSDGSRRQVALCQVPFAESDGTRCRLVVVYPDGVGATLPALVQLNRMYEARKRCSRAILLCKSRDALLAEVCRVLADTQQLALAWYGAVDPATLAVQPLARCGEEERFLDAAYFSIDARVEEGRGPVGRALREARPLVSNDFLRDAATVPWQTLAGRHRMQAIAVLPLTDNDAQPGVLVLHARDAGFFDPQRLQFLTELTEEISAAIESLERDAALHSSEARFRTLWETVLDAIVILDRQSLIHYANPAVTSLFGYRIEEVIGRSFCMLYPAPEAEAHLQAMRRYLDAPRERRRWRAVSSTGRHRDGRHFPIEITFSDVIIDGERRFIGYVRDVTQRKQIEQLSRKQNDILRRIAGGARLEQTLEAVARLVEGELQQTDCLLLVAAADGRKFNLCVAPSTPRPVARELIANGISDLGGPAGFAASRRQAVLLPDLSAVGDWQEPLRRSSERGIEAVFCWPITGRSAGLSGVLVLERRVAGPLDQSHNRVVQLALDLAGVAIENRRSEETIQHLARYDELTGLANRAALTGALDQSISRAQRGAAQVGVLFVGLDRFKDINDANGHETGDMVLREIARRLQKVLRKGDQVGRWGGDEFIVLVEQNPDAGVLTRIAGKLIRTIAAPIAVTGRECRVSASVGICTWPEDGSDLHALLRNADLALSRAKAQGGNGFRFHSDPLQSGSNRRMLRESELSRAIELDQLVVHYQPILDLRRGGIAGIEAFLRWQHPQQGLLWPPDFVEIAERSGHIVEMGRLMLRRACLQMREWQRGGLSARISINLSGRQLASDNLISDVANALAESGLPPGMLDLELSEATLVSTRDASRVLNELRAMGVHLTIDDFGIGQSSLTHLKSHPIETVKIDRSLIRDVSRGADSAAMTRAIIAMAHALGLRVIAEGVETADQRNFLHQQHCDALQGYLFNAPVAAGDLEKVIREHGGSGRNDSTSPRRLTKIPGRLSLARDPD